MTSKYAPVISSTGIAAPNFATNLANLIEDYEAIFGSDSYLGNDSQDGQLLGVFAQAITDCGAAAVAVYNSFSPATGVGAGLSSNVKLNGLARLPATYSTVPLSLTGVANQTINDGQAYDTSGNLWNLPAVVTFSSGGTASVLATANVAGAVNAAPDTVTGINTPTYGWQSVTNALAATAGINVESDAALRVRQAESVSLPSQTIFEGITANILQSTGVTRATGYENNTGSTNGDGIPAHSLGFVVEHGAQNSIINAIFAKIPPGVGCYGSTTQTVTDSYGSTRVLAYTASVAANIAVAITLTPLNGWSSATETLIENAVASYINGLSIGQNVSYTGMFTAAYLPPPYLGTYNITALTLAKNSGSPVSSDVTINWDEAPTSAPSSVAITA